MQKAVWILVSLLEVFVPSCFYSNTAFAFLASLSQISNRRVTLNALAQNKIKAIKGKFYLFARYPYFKFCCAIKRTEKRLTLYKTGALFDKNWNLLNESRVVTF